MLVIGCGCCLLFVVLRFAGCCFCLCVAVADVVVRCLVVFVACCC